MKQSFAGFAAAVVACKRSCKLCSSGATADQVACVAVSGGPQAAGMLARDCVELTGPCEAIHPWLAASSGRCQLTAAAHMGVIGMPCLFDRHLNNVFAHAG